MVVYEDQVTRYDRKKDRNLPSFRTEPKEVFAVLTDYFEKDSPYTYGAVRGYYQASIFANADMKLPCQSGPHSTVEEALESLLREVSSIIQRKVDHQFDAH